MKKRMVTALINNQNGVLTRLMALFTKHQYQIESLALTVFTEGKEISKMSVIVEVEDDHKFFQLVKLVNKQIDVLYVSDVTDEYIIDREISMLRKLLI